MLGLWPDLYDICDGSFTPTPTETKVFVNFVSHDSEVKVDTSPSALVKQDWKKRMFYGLIWKEVWIYLLGSGSSLESSELGIIWIFSLLIQLGFKSHGNVWKQLLYAIKRQNRKVEKIRIACWNISEKRNLKKKNVPGRYLLWEEEIDHGNLVKIVRNVFCTFCSIISMIPLASINRWFWDSTGWLESWPALVLQRYPGWRTAELPGCQVSCLVNYKSLTQPLTTRWTEKTETK